MAVLLWWTQQLVAQNPTGWGCVCHDLCLISSELLVIETSGDNHQPSKASMKPGQTIHMCPEHQGYRYHFEADLQQLCMIAVTPFDQEAGDEKQILQVFQMN
jgi:hypothetical protein